ncbi:NAD(P)-binding protein [Coniochaeta ligniaria NRRL 30616]|uniref:NAD(P)-binding protein n=1 Tax=Coniochaeta ligniaria NRRL 30616 TaxID=1408157 RepID=A0A1J7JSX5_9PEZI|nr:NAD(P)-binding protein [Coniochaeta ligniaria NRRL 30616]
MSPLNFRKLQDKHVLVIGGSSGIGLAVSEGALASGANVTISSSSQSKIDNAVSTFKPTYPDRKIVGIAADLGKPGTLEADLDNLFKTAVAANGTIHHVVYTAADSLSLGGLDTVTVDLMAKAAHMRMYVPVMLAKVAARHLPKERHSSLTITSGSVVDKPAPGWAVVAYLAGGLVALARALAVDLAPVRVNVVQPGFVDTPLWNMTEDAKKATIAAVEGKVLTRKFGEAEDVAEAYLWVMKDNNVTGTVAKTDGGFLLT